MERAAQDTASASKLSHTVDPPADTSAERSLSSPGIGFVTAAYNEGIQPGVETSGEQSSTFRELSDPHTKENRELQPSRGQTAIPQEATQICETATIGKPDGAGNISDQFQSSLQRLKVSRSKNDQPSGSPRVLQEEYGGKPSPLKVSCLDIGSSNRVSQAPPFGQLSKGAGAGFLFSDMLNLDSLWQTDYLMNPSGIVYDSRTCHMAISKAMSHGFQRLAKPAGHEVPSAEKVWQNARSGELSVGGVGSRVQEGVELGKQSGVSSPHDYNVVAQKEIPARVENQAKSDDTNAPTAEQLWKNARPGEFSFWNSAGRVKELKFQQAEKSKASPWAQDAKTRREQSLFAKSVEPQDTAPPSCDQFWQSARAGALSSMLGGKARELGVKRKSELRSVSWSPSCQVAEPPSARKLWDNARPGMLSLLTPSPITQKTAMQQNKKKKSVSWAQSFDRLIGMTQLFKDPETPQSHDLGVLSSQRIWNTAFPNDLGFRSRTFTENELAAQPSGSKTPESWSQSCNVGINEGYDPELSKEMIFQNTEVPFLDNPENSIYPWKSHWSSHTSEKFQAQTDSLSSVPIPKVSKETPWSVLAHRNKLENYYREAQQDLCRSIPGEEDLAVRFPRQFLPEKPMEAHAGSEDTGINSLGFAQRYFYYWDICVHRGSKDALRLELKEPIEDFVEGIVQKYHGGKVKPEHRTFQLHRRWLLNGMYVLLHDVRIVWRAFPLIELNQPKGLDSLLNKAWMIYKSVWRNFYKFEEDAQDSWKFQTFTPEEIESHMMRVKHDLSANGDKTRQLTAARCLLLLWLGEASPELFKIARVRHRKMKLQPRFTEILNQFHRVEASRTDIGD